jgi:hypothetical protein
MQMSLGTIRPDVYLRNLTELSGIYPALNHAVQWIRPTLVSHLCHRFFIAGHLGEQARLADVVGHWFLNIYVLVRAAWQMVLPVRDREWRWSMHQYPFPVRA